MSALDPQHNLWNTALRIAPILYIDRLEPFLPVRVGLTIMAEPGPSPSFDRVIDFEPEQVALVIEYAIYWDYDIQHIYDLEHVWIYLNHRGEIANCEASFHGQYHDGLLRDRSNLTEDGRVKLFVQPGKHAMSPLEENLRLLPNAVSCCQEEAGKDGVLENEMFRGQFKFGEQVDQLAEAHLRTFCFRPSFDYVPYTWADDTFVPWEELRSEIPARLKALLAELS
ncbi:hypothetical protein JCM10914A_43440 [Paenibacillus sp. JCM 10914]|uniref:hypothetical protein n=1 Tax=Paenibacillus sp. JCM 10914 TaxID=1236974 RepID=UPI0003CCAC62|nr:hypothetical protein [Paenibacillus sp. JCM 10914]GAE05564.1 hypothetical protein JCM10914_1672 [Paenibacillus sp. JCM 10914]